MFHLYIFYILKFFCINLYIDSNGQHKLSYRLQEKIAQKAINKIPPMITASCKKIRKCSSI